LTWFARWGRFIYCWRYATLVLTGLLLAGSILMLISGGSLRNSPTNVGESWDAYQLMQKELPRSPTAEQTTSFTVILGSDALSPSDPAFKEAVLVALAPLRADPRVAEVSLPYEDAGAVLPGRQSRDGRYVTAFVTVKGSVRASEKAYPALRALIRSDRLQIVATGGLAVQSDFDRLLDGDLRRAETLSLPLALILLLLVFGTVVGALLPLGVGVLALMGGIAAAFLLSRVIDVSPYALNVVALIGLGVAIDYSLFILNRFREELARGAPVEDALARTLATAGRAIAFSGITVAIGLAGMLFYGNVFSSLGITGGAVVAIAVFYALTFLPALLAVLGPRVNRWRLPFPRRRSERRLWHDIAMGVMRRPILVLIPTVAFILLAGSPFLSMRLAAQEAIALPPNQESRRGLEILQREFPGYADDRITVVAQFPDGQPLSPAHVGALYDVSRRVAQLPHVTGVQLGQRDYQQLSTGPPAAIETLPVGAHIAVLKVTVSKSPQSDEARAVVRAIRRQSLEGGRLLVTGGTAIDLDSVDFTIRRTPPAVAFVTLVTYLVLFLLLGSVLLPLKAVVMNLLSLSASFGAMVWIFQQGHLSAQLNFTPASIDPVLPVLLFSIVFGLSMDYEVFLLSRIQEEYRRSGDNRRAVAEGLERSGRLVTGAAAIMVAIFSAFALGDVLVVKSVGLAMAIAVAIDATVVRALIVPATMRLLGGLNWWAPRPLTRFHRRLGLSEEGVSSAG
jgi:RND superfamily putative drug exporter